MATGDRQMWHKERHGDVTGRQSDKAKVALCTIAFREKLLDYTLSVASELGVDGVEIWGREPHISEKFDENRVRTAQRMVQRRGLRIPVFGSYLSFGLTHPRIDDTIELEATLHTARCLNAPIVRIWASDVSSSQASAAVWTRTVREIREACDQAAKLGITLSAEMHDNTLADTGRGARQLVEAVGRGNFGLNFQISAYSDRGEAVDERLATVLPFVVHVHARNYLRLLLDGGGDVLERAPLGCGVIDYEGLVGQLLASGYDGYLAVEFAYAEGEGKREALLHDVTYLQALTSSIAGSKASGVSAES